MARLQSSGQKLTTALRMHSLIQDAGQDLLKPCQEAQHAVLVLNERRDKGRVAWLSSIREGAGGKATWSAGPHAGLSDATGTSATAYPFLNDKVWVRGYRASKGTCPMRGPCAHVRSEVGTLKPRARSDTLTGSRTVYPGRNGMPEWAMPPPHATLSRWVIPVVTSSTTTFLAKECPCFILELINGCMLLFS